MRNYYKTIIDEFDFVNGSNKAPYVQFIRKNITHLFFLSFYFAFYHFFRCVFFIYLINLQILLFFFLNIETIIIFRNILSYRMWFSAKVKRLKDYELFLTAWQTSETTEMVHLFSVKHRAVYGVCLDIWSNVTIYGFWLFSSKRLSMLELEPCSHEIFAVYGIYNRGLLPLEKIMSWS